MGFGLFIIDTIEKMSNEEFIILFGCWDGGHRTVRLTLSYLLWGVKMERKKRKRNGRKNKQMTRLGISI